MILRKKRIIILLIVTIVICICVFLFNSSPISYKYIRQIKEICDIDNYSIKYDNLYKPDEDDCDYVLELCTIINNGVYSDNYLHDSIETYSKLLNQINGDSNNPMRNKRIRMEISENDNSGTGILILQNYYSAKQTDYFIPNKCISISDNTVFVNNTNGIELVKGSLMHLDISGLEAVDVSILCELKELTSLKLVNCTYKSGEKALSESDIALIRQNDPHIEIVCN